MNSLLDLLNIKYPIIQAPVGGIATPELAAAVSNCGALGGLALSWSSPEDSEHKIKRFQSLSSQPLYANFVLNFEPKALKRTLDLGVKIIQFSWGMPSKTLVDLVKSYRAKIGVQVTSKQSALNAITLGADYLICQGIEAGGHVQANKVLENALLEVIEVSNDIPVIASGGISSGYDLKRVFNLGASGVVMGSRFVACLESGAHAIYKEFLVNSTSDQTVLTVCMNKGWDNAKHRILLNSTFKSWESQGCYAVGKRPGEFDVIAKHSNGKMIERYSFTAPTNDIEGAIEAMTMYAGKSVDCIKEIKPARAIIKDIWNEYVSLKYN